MVITNSAMDRRTIFKNQSEVRKRSTFNVSIGEDHIAEKTEEKRTQSLSKSFQTQHGVTPIKSFLHSSAKILRTLSISQGQNKDAIVEVDTQPRSQESPRQVEESFHSAIKWILKTAQLFGLLPVQGILESDPNQLHFHIFSIQVAYTAVLILCFLVLEVMSLWYLGTRINTDRTKVLGEVKEVIGATIFYGNAVIATSLFMKLASRWRTMIINWGEVEKKVQGLNLSNLSRRFSIMTAIVMIPAFVEYFLSLSVNYKKVSEQLAGSDFFEAYINHSFTFIFKNGALKYSTVLGVFACASCTIATFIWNFTDLFIILVSMALTQHFTHFNKCVKQSREQAHENQWRTLREHYHSLSTLVKDIDNEISGIVLLSFINNLGFIGLQFLNSLIKYSTLQKVYFFISFLFLLVRIFLVTRYASKIHEESRACLHDIYSCPSEKYCIELQRLQTQVTTDEIALTGLRVFSVTRNLMLVVTGSIFTYAVILLQFYVALQPLN